MKRNVLIVLLISVPLVCGFDYNSNAATPGEDIFADFSRPPKAVSPHFELLRFGSVKPKGWIKAQMERDLTQGLTGHLDKIAPDIVAGDVFGENRRSKSKVFVTEDKWVAATWFNGESEANWRDGYIRTAYLTGNQEAIEKSKDYVKHILGTQDDDGYLGIYDPDTRFQNKGANGELWTKTCLLRALLGYYELTGEEEVLEAVKRSVDLTMQTYGENKKSYNKVFEIGGGVMHGLMYTDVLETLHRLTGDDSYAKFGLWLYKDYCDYFSIQDDSQLHRLLDKEKPFYGHGVHSFEHLRPIIWSYYISGYPVLEKAQENAYYKAVRHLTPSGAPIGDESVSGSKPSPGTEAYDFCIIHEGMHSFISALQKTGKSNFGDLAERAFFNAAQGNRLPDGKGVTYLKTDNCYVLNRRTPSLTPERINTFLYDVNGNVNLNIRNLIDGLSLKTALFSLYDARFKYSPTHRDAAMCCPPNLGRIKPYYVGHMWMRAGSAGKGLAAVLYGPCSVTTEIDGTVVTINEETNYPFVDTITFTIMPAREINFDLILRNPSWSKNTRVEIQNAEINREGNYFIVNKTWKKGDVVRITFAPDIEISVAANGEKFLKRGALVYALNIPSEKKVLKRKYPVEGFHDLEYYPINKEFKNYAFLKSNSGDSFGFIFNASDKRNIDYPYDEPVVQLDGELINVKTNESKPVSLVPAGNTILRRITFPVQ